MSTFSLSLERRVCADPGGAHLAKKGPRYSNRKRGTTGHEDINQPVANTFSRTVCSLPVTLYQHSNKMARKLPRGDA